MYKLENFSKVRVLVIGDIMIDKYLWGDVRRISPEAPVPVVNLKDQTLIPGGAANVAANIAGLGAEAYLLGLVGNDSDGNSFGQILKKFNVSDEHIVQTESRPTIVKTRIMAHNQQIARLDQETILDLTNFEEASLYAKVEELAEKTDIIVASDYGKGLLTESMLARLIKFAEKRSIPVMVDPKGRNYSKYSGATLITPNKFELGEVCGCRSDDYKELELGAIKLLDELRLKALVMTRGEDGITLFQKNIMPNTIKAVKRKVYDVTGAGDTFISVLAVACGAKNDLESACQIANTAAGLVVQELGTTVIAFKDLEQVINN